MSRRTRIYLALGSNLGDRLDYFQRALDALGSAARLQRVGQIYETEPWGVTDQPRFLNTAVEAETALAPLDLLMILKTLEAGLGRQATVRYGPRVIDIDILLYGSQTVTGPSLEIPHPRMAERAFVLTPLADLAPDLRPPGWTRTIREQLETLDRSGVAPYPAALLKVTLQPAGPKGGSALVQLPAEVSRVLGRKGRAPVRCRFDSVEFRSSIFPNGDGTHYLVLNQQVRNTAGCKVGDEILLRIEPDHEPRVVEIPADLQAALQANPAAAACLEKMSYTHIKEYVDHIQSARTPETRARRIRMMLDALNKKE